MISPQAAKAVSRVSLMLYYGVAHLVACRGHLAGDALVAFEHGRF